MKQPRLIVMTGAEASGKTTLGSALAERLAAPFVAEASRDLLVPGVTYDADDIVRIGQEQVRRENAALAATPGRVVADTDLLVLRIWLDERFGCWPAVLEELWRAAAPRLYVLTTPQMPWEPDPLRENPHDRDRLHQRYVQWLVANDVPWLEVRGTVEERLRQVMAKIGL
jgi:nicotinamide riboside kinase